MSTVVRNLVTIMEDIAAAMEYLQDEIPGLQIVPYLNPNPTPPSIDIYPGSPFQIGAAFPVQSVQLFFTIRARVSTADHQSGWRLLYRLMDPTDPASVEAAVQDVVAVPADSGVEYGEYQVDPPTNGRLLGCEWTVSTFL